MLLQFVIVCALAARIQEPALLPAGPSNPETAAVTAQGTGDQTGDPARNADSGQIRSMMVLAMPCSGFIHS